MSNGELFLKLLRRSLAFKVFAVLLKYDNSHPYEIKVLLGNRHNGEALHNALRFLEKHGLITRDKYKVLVNRKNPFAVMLMEFINALFEKGLWDAFEEVFLRFSTRMRIIMALMNGPMTKTQIVAECTGQGGTYTNKMLEPLERHGLVIKHNSKHTIYELNHNNPLVIELEKFLTKLDGKRSNHRDNYSSIAKEVVDYVLAHWDEYAINPHNKGTIKLTGKLIKGILKKKNIRVKHIGWLLAYAIEEFKERGFPVQVVRNGKRRNADGIRVYVSKTRGDGNGE